MVGGLFEAYSEMFLIEDIMENLEKLKKFNITPLDGNFSKAKKEKYFRRFMRRHLRFIKKHYTGAKNHLDIYYSWIFCKLKEWLEQEGD